MTLPSSDINWLQTGTLPQVPVSTITNTELPDYQSYRIPVGKDCNVELSLMGSREVWGPHSASDFISVVATSGIPIQNQRVIDLGTGTGVIGLALAKLGANVIMTDLYPAATTLANINSRLNGTERNASALVSDVYENLPNDDKVDLIVANLPMNPEVEGISVKNPAYLTNQRGNGPEGRTILKRAIKGARSHLKENGIMVMSTSSRQNWISVKNDLDNEFGPGNWKIINNPPHERRIKGIVEGIHDPLSTDYHGPYVTKWILDSLTDGMLRVYYLDEQGLPFLSHTTGEGRIKTTTTFFYHINTQTGKYSYLRYVKKGNSITIDELNEEGTKIRALDPSEINEITPPEVHDGGQLYHAYRMVAAINNPKFAAEM